ncbi:MAG: NADPH:quinone reductase [SAR86 cluster bacterium]|uniref:NADPH:quinone reductase n=1 Tax=SAR86 cluster bacterium TaxID=2030880 RepID=A0A2A5AVM5_9GAMM|nr:MAG: NADPH:quinone reductase [SAR86 cluster bacterium]
MKAAFINSYGQFDQIKIGDIDRPEIDDHDVLIKMKAASVNPIDWKMVHGDLKALIKLKFPLVLGSDGAGVIEEVGAGVTEFNVGDEVFFRCDKANIGTFAEYFAIPANLIAKKPTNMSFEEAASIPLVGLTTYQALKEKAGMTEGSRVLIHAGAGGVGSFAIQFAKAFGAHVATTASKKRFVLLAELGADEIIDYQSQHIENELNGFDIVFNTLGDSVQEPSYKTLKKGGVLVNVLGIPEPLVVAQYTSNILVKLISHINQWRKEGLAAKYNAKYKHLLMYADGKQLREIADLIEAGKIRAIIDSTFPLAKVKEAFERSATGRAQGKIIIKISD